MTIDEFLADIRQRQNIPDTISTPVTTQNVNPYSNSNDLGTLTGAFFAGGGKMANDTVLGGLAHVLGLLGRGAEYLSPYSGRDDNAVEQLQRLGINQEIIDQTLPYEDSYLTSGAKKLLEWHNKFDDSISNWRNELLGNNPSLPAQIAEGFGSSIGFMLPGGLAAKVGGPLLGALAAGGLEALSESGGMLGDAYRKGQYDNGAISAANSSFLSNAVLNTGLDYIFSPFGKIAGKFANPVTRWGAGTLSSIANELLQEPSQQVINSAALNSLDNGESFMSNLGESIQQWPQILGELAPSIAGSALLTQAVLGSLGLTAPYEGNNRVQQAGKNNTQSTVNQTPSTENVNIPPAVSRTARTQNQLTLPLEDTQTQTQATAPVQQIIPAPAITTAVPQNPVNSAISERPKGSATTVETEGGLKADVQYRIVDADDLITSHIDDKGQFKSNQNYPQNLQPRDRIRDNDDQVRHIANNINPARLADSVMAADGAPIISPEGIVISGNGRTLAIKRAYNISKADDYRQFLKDNASRFGISPEILDSISKPVLVRELTSDVDLEEFARQSNTSSVAAMSSTEQAQNDARYITPEMLTLIDPSKPIHDNPEFVSSFVSKIPANEKNTLRDAHGALSKNAYRRAEYALASMAYGDSTIISRLSETMDDDLTNISKALLKAAPAVATLNNGAINTDLSLKPEFSAIAATIQEAVRRMQHAKSNNKTIAEYLSTRDMIDPTTQNAAKIMEFFDRNKKSPNKMAQFLINYVNLANQQAQNGQGVMFKDANRGKDSILEQALREADQDINGQNDSESFQQSENEQTPQDKQFHIGRQNSISDVWDIMLSPSNRKISANIWADYARVSSDEAKRISEATGLKIEDGYVHSITGEAAAHVQDRHGEGNEQRQDQLPITKDDFERIPEIIRNPDEIKLGLEKTTWGSNDTIVYKKRINGHILAVEEVRTRRRKLTLHSMRKTKAGYDYDLSKEGNPIVKDNAKSQAVTSNNDPIPEVQSTHALSNIQSLDNQNDNVNTQNNADKANKNENFQQSPVNENVSNENRDQNQNKNSSSDYDGFVGDLNINHSGDEYSASIFLDEYNGKPYLDITDNDGNSVAVYDMASDTFHIRPESQKTGWVRRIEDDMRREFGKKIPEEALRRTFRQKAIDAGLEADYADAAATVYTAANKFFAKYSGKSLYDIIKSDNLSITRQKSNHNQKLRGETEFIKPETDNSGNVIKEAQTIVKLFENADKSTLLHEMGHIFLHKFKTLDQKGLLSGRAKLDWGTIKNEYGLQNIDFSKELSKEELRKWINGNEKFASGLESFFWQNKAPENASGRIKHVFNAFKKWLHQIYSSIRNIKYTDDKGKTHEIHISKDITAVFDDLISEGKYKPEIISSQNNNQNINQNIKPLTLDNMRFLNDESEQRYSGAKNQSGIIAKINNAARSVINGLKGDFSELSQSKRNDVNLLKAQEEFRKLNRRKANAANQAVSSIVDVLRRLDPKKRELFTRYRILQDLMFQIEDMPDSDLPFGFDKESLKTEYERFTALVESNKDVKDAITAEENTMRELNTEFTELGKQLGLDFGSVFRNPHYYRHRIIQYAQASAQGVRRTSPVGNVEAQAFADAAMRGIIGRSWLKKRKGSQLDFMTDYLQANAEVRIQMRQDIETMKTLLWLKNEFDIAPKLREKIKQNLTAQKNTSKQDVKQDPNSGSEKFSQSDNSVDDLISSIPEGHTLFDIGGSRLIEGNRTAAENVISMAADDLSKQSGIPLDKILSFWGMSELQGELFNSERICVFPDEIVKTLEKLSRSRNRGALGQLAKDITTFWKKTVIYSPFRNLIYYVRNMTGDLDALIAGNYNALKQVPRSVKELTDYFLHRNEDGFSASRDLQDYIERSEGLGIPSLSLTRTEAAQLVDIFKSAFPHTRGGDPVSSRANPVKVIFSPHTWGYSVPVRKTAGYIKSQLGLVRKFFKAEQDFTAWREHLLRYAAYLDYKQQMESNSGKPKTWGASIEEEVMALDNIKDRAYKMSNELLGAYDQVSETGKQLRDMLIPFYSWMEVNMRRYYRLLKNGLNGKNNSDFTRRLLMGKAAGIPFYALSAVDSLGKIALFTAAIQLFNRLVWPDADDELPENVKYLPHITLGKSSKGDIYYFDRIGAAADILDWGALDSIVPDVRDMVNGQLSLGRWVKKILQAPVNKVLNGLNPMLKMPIELAMGRSMYPNVFHPSTIRDPARYVAQSIGRLNWPYKALTGEPHSNLREFTNLFMYSVNADEAAYYQTLDKVREFQNRVLDKHFDGFATTRRGDILRKVKTAMRYGDKQLIRRYLREYAQAGGSDKGVKQSMKAMDPLFGLSKDEKKQFLRWITQSDRKYLMKANKYYHSLVDRFIK